MMYFVAACAFLFCLSGVMLIVSLMEADNVEDD